MLKLLIKNVSSKLDGFLPAPAYHEINDVLAYFIVGAEYSDKFMSGEWDGFKRLFNRTKKTFPTGLLGLVMGILEKHDIRFSVEDLRHRPKITKIYKIKKDIVPRPYQLEGVQKALIYGRGLIEAATGAGKSFMIAMIAARLGLPTVIYVNTKDLLYQMINDLKCIDTDEDIIGQMGDGIVDPKLFTVATVQTACLALGAKYAKFDEEDQPGDEEIPEGKKELIVQTVQNASVMIIDETQFLASDTFQLVAHHSKSAFYRYGLSGTPVRTDNADILLNAATGKKIFSIRASELVEKGFLLAPDITVCQLPKPFALETGSSYQTIYKTMVADNEVSNNLIVDIAKFFYDNDRTTLILIQHISHGEIIQAKLKTFIDTELIETLGKGRSAHKIRDIEFLKGPVNTDKRKRVVQLFRDRKVKILIATALADCGLNIPSLDVLIMGSRGKSISRVPQRIGRVIRISPGKKKALVFDFYDPVKYLNVQSKQREEIYAQEQAFRVHRFKLGGQVSLSQYLKGMILGG